MAAYRDDPTATLLPDGGVLVDLATGFQAALDKLGKHRKSMPMR
jgi:hypothetical protein